MILSQKLRLRIATFEGAIYYRAKGNRWFVLYNPTVKSAGRINFTLGHELGHYLNHRHLIRSGAGYLECSERSVLGVGDGAGQQIEREANTFASYLLMPMDDFRRQVSSEPMTRDLLAHCADRYGVSLTAAARKWVTFTRERAVLVVGRDGFVLWARSSDAAFKSGVYFKSGAPLPSRSAATSRGGAVAGESSNVEHAPGIWVRDEASREVTIFADRYDLTISLVLLAKDPPIRQAQGRHHDQHTPDLLDEIRLKRT